MALMSYVSISLQFPSGIGTHFACFSLEEGGAFCSADISGNSYIVVPWEPITAGSMDEKKNHVYLISLHPNSEIRNPYP